MIEGDHIVVDGKKIPLRGKRAMMKFLGVKLNLGLNWTQEYRSMKQKLALKLNAIKKVSKSLKQTSH